MKKIVLLLFMASVLFALEQVPRQKNSGDDNETKANSEVRPSDSRTSTRQLRNNTEITTQSDKKQPDRFQDKNSNGVNDRREDDFQSIKTKKSKYKELIGKKDDQKEKKQKENTPREDRESERKK